MINDLSLTDLMRLLTKKSWVLFVCSITLGVIVFFFNVYFIKPTYVSKGMLYVNNTNSLNSTSSITSKNVNLSDIAASQKLATTYIEILKSDTYMKLVSECSGMGYSPAKMRSKISIKSKNETEILEIAAVDKSPENASLITNAMLTNAKDEIIRVIKNGSVEIIDNADFPMRPYAPNIPKNTVIGIIIGLIFGVIIIYLMDLFDNRIKNQEDLINKYQYPILGLIPNFNSDKESNYNYHNNM